MGYDLHLFDCGRNYDEEMENNLRINFFQMPNLRGVMRELGMLHEGRTPRFPRLPDEYDYLWGDGLMMSLFSDPTECWDGEGELEGIDADTLKVLRRYARRNIQVFFSVPRSWKGGICVYKLSSNDEWVVSPEEIKTALATYNSRTDDRVLSKALWTNGVDRDKWDEWIKWLEGAVNCGGFTVS